MSLPWLFVHLDCHAQATVRVICFGQAFDPLVVTFGHCACFNMAAVSKAVCCFCHTSQQFVSLLHVSEWSICAMFPKHHRKETVQCVCCKKNKNLHAAFFVAWRCLLMTKHSGKLLLDNLQAEGFFQCWIRLFADSLKFKSLLPSSECRCFTHVRTGDLRTCKHINLHFCLTLVCVFFEGARLNFLTIQSVKRKNAHFNTVC